MPHFDASPASGNGIFSWWEEITEHYIFSDVAEAWAVFFAKIKIKSLGQSC
jgi:hypothetical protein